MMKDQIKPPRLSIYARSGLVMAAFAVTAAILFATFSRVPSTSLFEARIYTASDQVRLPYRLYVPPNYAPTKKYPLVIYLHGSDAIGNDNLKQITGYNVAGTRIWTEKGNRE